MARRCNTRDQLAAPAYPVTTRSARGRVRETVLFNELRHVEWVEPHAPRGNADAG